MTTSTSEKKRTIMETLTIGELSGVDFPAMEGSKAVLLKRFDPVDDVEKRGLLEYQNPRATNSVNGHQHLLDDSGRAGLTTWEISTGKEFSHQHSWIRNMDGSIDVLVSEDHDHQVLVSKHARATDIAIKSASGGKESIMDKDTAEDSAVTQDQLDEMQKRAERAEKISELTDTQRSFYKDLGESEQESFLQLDADGRQNEVEKATAADPVVYKDAEGNEYRKSDDQRVVAAVKRADRAEKLAREDRAKAQDSELSKRADKLTFVKGKDEVKVALLKAIDGIEDEDLRKGAIEIVEAANSGMKQAFEKRGTAFGDTEPSDAEARYEKLSQEYSKANSCTIEKARADVITAPENAELAEELTQRAPVID